MAPGLQRSAAPRKHLAGYRLPHLQPGTANHPPSMQDQLTCKTLDLSPNDWYGYRGQVTVALLRIGRGWEYGGNIIERFPFVPAP